MKFGVRTAEPLSAAKKVLLALKPGDQVRATSVGGDFVLPRDQAKPLLLMAAGIGITPYLAHLSSGAAQDRDVVLLLLARNAEEIAYAEELRTLRGADHCPPRRRFRPAVVHHGRRNRGWRGRPAGRGRAAGACARHRRTDRLCVRIAVQCGFPAPRGQGSRGTPVHVDSFSGY